MQYDLSLNHHEDVCLRTEENIINLGYSGLTILPSVCWLHNIQTQKRNILQSQPITVAINRLSNQAPRNQEYIQNAIKTAVACTSLARLLPIHEEKFNVEVENFPFTDLFNGTFSVNYHFELQRDNLNLIYKLRKREAEDPQDPIIVLSLTPDNSQELAQKYVLWLMKEPKLEVYHRPICEVASRLRDYK